MFIPPAATPTLTLNIVEIPSIQKKETQTKTIAQNKTNQSQFVFVL